MISGDNMIKAKCNTNIALVKYWGKRDENLYLPMTSSISMTLKEFYTITSVDFIDSHEDIFILDGIIQNEKETKKVSRFIDIFREKANIYKKVKVDSINHVATAAGLASSASAYGALAGGLNLLFDLNLNMVELSKLARRGSGSATRSLMSGFVKWDKGIMPNGEDSKAIQLDNGYWDIAMAVVLIDEEKKKISSTEAMKRTIETSPFYEGWVNEQELDILQMERAIKNRDVDKIGKIAERNALKMHATMLGAKPPIIYFQEGTFKVMRIVETLREYGFSLYYTMDAGPNVKIICKKSELDLIEKELEKYFSKDKIITSEIGSGLEILYDDRS